MNDSVQLFVFKHPHFLLIRKFLISKFLPTNFHQHSLAFVFSLAAEREDSFESAQKSKSGRLSHYTDTTSVLPGKHKLFVASGSK